MKVEKPIFISEYIFFCLTQKIYIVINFFNNNITRVSNPREFCGGKHEKPTDKLNK